jgi:erythrin-vacuolar iron transport family protein
LYYRGMSELVARLAGRMAPADEERFMLQRVQPALIGLIDGTVSTLAPIFATAFLAGSHAALFVGLAAALGAGISMGLSEALSDDGSLTGRGTSMSRGVITGGATFLGGGFHALPFLIGDLHTALLVASLTVGCELIVIAWVRKRFLDVSLKSSLIQVTLGGAIVAITGVLIGQA